MRLKKTCFVLMLALCANAAAASGASAESPRALVSRGNKQYHKKDFAKALELYDRASVKAPESPIVAFNKGAALYKGGDLEKAREQFQEAAAKTKNLDFESKAWYNLGNCAFEEGKRQEDSDLQKALESLEESVKHYVTALEKDAGNTAAAENLEIARLKIKDLLDKIQKQQQEGGQQNQQNQQGQQDQQNQQQQGKQEQQEQQDKEQQQQGAEQSEDTKRQDDKNKQGAPKEQQKKQLARDATAQEILDQEKKDRKEQQLQKSGYRPVEKDW